MSLCNFVLASRTQLFQYFLTSLFSTSATSYISFLAFCSLSLLLHGVKLLWTLPQQSGREPTEKSCRYPMVFTRDSHLCWVWSLPHFLRQPYQAVDSHSACDIPTPHALSQHWYLLRYPSSAFIHLFSLPHCRPSHLHFLNSHLTHFNHFCILSRPIWTPNLPSTMPQNTRAYSPLPAVLSSPSAKTLMKTTSSTWSWAESNRTVLRAPFHLPNKQ